MNIGLEQYRKQDGRNGYCKKMIFPFDNDIKQSYIIEETIHNKLFIANGCMIFMTVPAETFLGIIRIDFFHDHDHNYSQEQAEIVETIMISQRIG